ncbi:MAG: hypothetical protein ACOCYU_03915 [Brevefilum sp.]
MDFGKILSKAWRIIWKHKILWLFGVLAGCGAGNAGGGGGGGTSSIQSQPRPRMDNGLDFLPPSTQRALQDFFNFLEAIPVWVWIIVAIIFIFLMIVFSVLILMLGTLGTTGVIEGTILADKADEEGKPLSFGEIFRGLKPYYWKVFLLNIGLRFAGFFLAIFLILPIIILAVCTCGLGMFLFIPLGWFISLMVNFTTIAIIEENENLFPAIGRAWQVIIRNLGNVLLMFLILGIGQLIAGLIIGLPLIIAPMPFLINGFATGFRNVTSGLVISGILFLALLPVVIFLGGVLKAYVLSSWTLTYRRLIQQEAIEPTVLSDTEIEEEQA